jgi:hypothetical protein
VMRQDRFTEGAQEVLAAFSSVIPRSPPRADDEESGGAGKQALRARATRPQIPSRRPVFQRSKVVAAQNDSQHLR